MTANSTRTLRLVLPQWQGGNNPTYQLGARLLAWLAPQNDSIVVEAPVTAPGQSAPAVEDGVFARTDLLAQTRAARDIIEREHPDRIVTFGGDCSVSLAPFAYLAAKYAGDVAVLWIDSHLDFSTSETSTHAHEYPMRTLLGEGDPAFSAFVTHAIPADRLVYVGVSKQHLGPECQSDLAQRGVTVFDPAELTPDFSEVVARLRATGASKLLVHFDVDVLDPKGFRSQLFSHPDGDPLQQLAGIATGKMQLHEVVQLLNRCEDTMDIVALSITEHLPWEAENMRQALAQISILS